MTPEVAEAVDDIKRHFGAGAVLVSPDKDGGAVVIVEGVALGKPYAQAETWVGFHITHACPYADVYPHFVRGDLKRADGLDLGEAITAPHQFPQPGVVVGDAIGSRAAVQISRRANKRDAGSGLETPLLKALKVLRWLKSR
ncbi:MAG: hypothetical protein EOS85_29400 [Mesorhizobium sp.]|nr:MAG: hypothetical protein EOS85_29400 [Mesorhizobium sp.]